MEVEVDSRTPGMMIARAAAGLRAGRGRGEGRSAVKTDRRRAEDAKSEEKARGEVKEHEKGRPEVEEAAMLASCSLQAWTLARVPPCGQSAGGRHAQPCTRYLGQK